MDSSQKITVSEKNDRTRVMTEWERGNTENGSSNIGSTEASD